MNCCFQPCGLQLGCCSPFLYLGLMNSCCNIGAQQCPPYLYQNNYNTNYQFPQCGVPCHEPYCPPVCEPYCPTPCSPTQCCPPPCCPTPCCQPIPEPYCPPYIQPFQTSCNGQYTPPCVPPCAPVAPCVKPVSDCCSGERHYDRMHVCHRYRRY